MHVENGLQLSVCLSVEKKLCVCERERENGAFKRRVKKHPCAYSVGSEQIYASAYLGVFFIYISEDETLGAFALPSGAGKLGKFD